MGELVRPHLILELEQRRRNVHFPLHELTNIIERERLILLTKKR